MNMQYELTTPCTAQDLAPLHAGDTVLLSGVVYTARDQAHKRMLEALDRGEPLPFDLEGSAIYYVGPTPERPGEIIGSAGPTTSGRMDAMSPRLLDLGNKVMIGKGKRDAAVKEAVVRNGAVYLAALGGAGALMAKSVKTLEVIAWPDLGCEAVRRLTGQLIDPFFFFFGGKGFPKPGADYTVQFAADFLHIPNSRDELGFCTCVAVKIVSHIVKVTILFALYKFTDCILIGNAVTVVYLKAISVFFIGHVNLEGTVIVNSYTN